MYRFFEPRAQSLQAGIQLYTKPLLLAAAFEQLELLATKHHATKPENAHAGPGCVVDLIDFFDGSEASFELVSPSEAAPEKKKISVLSPLGSSLLGLKKGGVARVNLWGSDHKFQVLDVRPSNLTAGPDAAPDCTSEEVAPL